MKKVLLVSLLFITITLSGCKQVTDTATNLEQAQQEIDALTTSMSNAEAQILEHMETLDNMQDSLNAQMDRIVELENEKLILLTEINLTNTKIKNALNRDDWSIRKVRFDDSWNLFDAEYCFGVFDEDWSLISANEYTHNTGLQFIITIEQSQWGTEIFAKDSCGNYSEFIVDDSSFGLYSTPSNFFEVGETYEVVLYKEIYFTVPQLGLLPFVEMGEFGSYPTDLSGIVSTKVE